MLITMTTEPTYLRWCVPLLARSDLLDSAWAQLLRIKINFIELFWQMDIAEQAKHLALLSLDHSDHH
jgi:hypothetical protein